MFDYPSRCGGHDERAPPPFLSEGPACQVRCTTLDCPFRLRGRDKHTPPKGNDKRALQFARRGIIGKLNAHTPIRARGPRWPIAGRPLSRARRQHSENSFVARAGQESSFAVDRSTLESRKHRRARRFLAIAFP